ncbi:type 1 glutamine amidotransferase [Shimia sp. R11_0]|uniref:type 1 glutamine amidotransferase n=1 Tax=Shimia sp. R11_0 TaxID=2821096 RepID=UPI001AD995A0|nr:type 1 glutamine amidotransferase [Shimia sp. R11_0]MBO9476526.1 type 1 glutamine amidotransferase [Shimia sp. R11_0]
MTRLLIVESNSTDLLAQSRSASAYFLKAFQALIPHAELRVVAPYAAPLTAAVFDGVDGIVFTGSGVDWTTCDARAAPLRAAMELAFATGLPVWGSCNGMQLAASVLGGHVNDSPNGLEFGLAAQVTFTEAGRAHPMFGQRDCGLSSPCIHSHEVVRLPEGAEILAFNAHSQVQAMAYTKGGVNFWGVQYHPEMSALDIGRIAGFLSLRDDHAAMVPDLMCADTDQAAAERLGVRAGDLSPHMRMRELSNWLTHIGVAA